jgi:three-Cys-motif partner protein
LKAYIDAFAGTGYRTMRRDDDEPSGSVLFPDLAEPASQGLLDGSARLALKTQPRFDRYIFVEKNAERCAELERLKAESRY